MIEKLKKLKLKVVQKNTEATIYGTVQNTKELILRSSKTLSEKAVIGKITQ